MNKDQSSFKVQGVKPRIFYGYIIAAISFCILLVVYGIRFSYGIFFTPMATELGWNSATTSLAYSVSMLVEGVANIILGGITDKYGPRVVLTVSGILMGTGYCLMMVVQSSWQFFLFYGFMIGIGMGGVFVPLIAVLTRWFTSRRGLMTGVVMSGGGVGILITAPLADKLIKVLSWQTTFLLMGIAILLVVVIGAQFIKHDPAAMGLTADGKPDQKIQNIDARVISLKKVIRIQQFWLIFLIFVCYGFISVSIAVHLVPYAISTGISSAIAAIIMAIMAGFQIMGRIGLGLLGDRVGNRPIFMIGFLLCIVSFFWTNYNQAIWAFLLFSFLFGIAQGGISTTQSQIIVEFFGVKSHGLLFGFCGFGYTTGAAIGPYILGHMFDITGTYHLAFIICAIISFIALVSTVILRPIQNRYSIKGQI